jgi:hypothetical protein
MIEPFLLSVRHDLPALRAFLRQLGGSLQQYFARENIFSALEGQTSGDQSCEFRCIESDSDLDPAGLEKTR